MSQDYFIEEYDTIYGNLGFINILTDYNIKKIKESDNRPTQDSELHHYKYKDKNDILELRTFPEDYTSYLNSYIETKFGTIYFYKDENEEEEEDEDENEEEEEDKDENENEEEDKDENEDDAVYIIGVLDTSRKKQKEQKNKKNKKQEEQEEQEENRNLIINSNSTYVILSGNISDGYFTPSDNKKNINI